MDEKGLLLYEISTVNVLLSGKVDEGGAAVVLMCPV
jgi:hypothetical protein